MATMSETIYGGKKAVGSKPPTGDNFKMVKNVYVEMIDGKPKFWFQYDDEE